MFLRLLPTSSTLRLFLRLLLGSRVLAATAGVLGLRVEVTFSTIVTAVAPLELRSRPVPLCMFLRLPVATSTTLHVLAPAGHVQHDLHHRRLDALAPAGHVQCPCGFSRALGVEVTASTIMYVVALASHVQYLCACSCALGINVTSSAIVFVLAPSGLRLFSVPV